MINPIYQRELVATLRTRKALFLQVVLVLLFAGLIVLRWPTDATVDLSGEQTRQVFRLFAYGLLTSTVLLVPVFPATSIVREKRQGTLALLFNSPLSPSKIYFGKLSAAMVFVLLLLGMSLPAAAACYAMGGLSLSGHLLSLYGLLILAAVQFATLGLLVSTLSNSTDAAMRLTYFLVLTLTILVLGPHLFVQGQPGLVPLVASWLRCLSPLPAVMQLVGHNDVGSRGFMTQGSAIARYVIMGGASSLLFGLVTLARLNHRILDRSRDQGVITDERGSAMQWLRRLVFLVDPQRRKRGIMFGVNPVMVKEFRTRRFGRSHWMMRLVAGCVLVSLGLTYVSSTGTMDWGPETIGGIMVVLQIALIVLITPSLTAGLISSELESGGWQLLQMTPLSPGVIVRGKLLSAAWTLVLILLATVPGYLVMVFIQPQMRFQIYRVLISLGWTTLFAILSSAAISSLFRRTAAATTTAYAFLIGLCAGTMLVWLGRDAPFGHRTVETVLTINPLAAALQVMRMPGFVEYNLVPINWWVMGIGSVLALVVLLGRVWQLSRPQ